MFEGFKSLQTNRQEVAQTTGEPSLRPQLADAKRSFTLRRASLDADLRLVTHGSPKLGTWCSLASTNSAIIASLSRHRAGACSFMKAI